MCKHCGTAFVTEKAINNFYTTNNFNTTNKVYAQNVVLQNNSREFEIVGGVLKSYKGSGVNIVIPNNVHEIAPLCFYGMYIQSVVIPGSVKVIRNSVFGNCSELKKVTLSHGVECIGAYAFCKCISLTEIEVPSSVKIIDYSAFSGCSRLTNIKIPSSVNEISSACFENCTSLHEIHFPNSVKELGHGVFKGCTNLVDVTLPDSITKIPEDSFRDCVSLRSIVANNILTQPMGAFGGIKGPASIYTKKRTYIIKNGCVKGDGCYIATSVYGSYDCPEVWTLRRYRDYTLDETWYGKLFIKCYYAISPTLVKWFGNQKWFRTFWKNRLDRIVSTLNQKGVENTEYKDKY